MRTLIAAIVLLSVAACSPPAAPPAVEAPPAAPEAPAADLSPYANEWDSTEFVRFNHTLRAAAPGAHAVKIAARTDGGTETVAVYPADASGQRSGGRLMFVVATAGGNEQSAELEIPEAGLPVVVVVENASGRPSKGDYALTVE